MLFNAFSFNIFDTRVKQTEGPLLAVALQLRVRYLDYIECF